jgi:hypothetical protein
MEDIPKDRDMKGVGKRHLALLSRGAKPTITDAATSTHHVEWAGARRLGPAALLAPSQIHVFLDEIAVGDSKAIAAFHLSD